MYLECFEVLTYLVYLCLKIFSPTHSETYSQREKKSSFGMPLY